MASVPGRIVDRPWLSITVWRRVLVGVVLLYAAGLRAEALIGKWGPLDGPPWARTFQTRLASTVSVLRPAHFGWSPEPYLWGDPYDDLENARQMRSFYRGSFREPVFVFTTRLFQGLVGDQPQAVCLASALFSTLTVAATYLLGASLFNWWVGLSAAFALGIERDVISAGVIGSRDDAFTFFLVLFVYVLLRARNDPTWRKGAICGLVAAAACLTRITSLTFALPAIGYLALAPSQASSRARWAAASGAAVMAAVVVVPFLISCWIDYGDPLYSISRLSSWYAERGSVSTRPASGIVGFLWPLVSTAPINRLETGILGLTTYQHHYKWAGFDPWFPGLGTTLQFLSVVGTFGMFWFSRGRMVVFVTACAMVPFVFTWTTPGLTPLHHFRFTQATYPFLLVAAFMVVGAAGRYLVGLRGDQRVGVVNRAVVIKVGATVAAMGAFWALLNVLPLLRLEEDLAAGHGAVLIAGPLDRAFFRSGWYPFLTSVSGNVTGHFSRGRSARVFVPMEPQRAHRLTLRMDPFVFPGAPTQHVAVAVNGAPLATFVLSWNPDRVGEYTLDVPAPVVTNRLGRIDLRADYSTRVGEVRPHPRSDTDPAASFSDLAGADDDVGFLLWGVVVMPR